MSYGVGDFAGDVEDALGVHIPERCYGDENARADICLEKIDWWKESHKALLEALKQAHDVLFPLLSGKAEQACKAAQEAIKLAETPPPDWPDEEEDDDDDHAD